MSWHTAWHNGGLVADGVTQPTNRRAGLPCGRCSRSCYSTVSRTDAPPLRGNGTDDSGGSYADKALA
ncbi:MAG: hypothetical protein WBF86_10220, partial [Mycobacterium sp.]